MTIALPNNFFFNYFVGSFCVYLYFLRLLEIEMKQENVVLNVFFTTLFMSLDVMTYPQTPPRKLCFFLFFFYWTRGNIPKHGFLTQHRCFKKIVLSLVHIVNQSNSQPMSMILLKNTGFWWKHRCMVKNQCLGVSPQSCRHSLDLPKLQVYRYYKP